MSALIWSSAVWLVIAQDDIFEALGRGFRDGPSGRSLLEFGLTTTVLITIFIVIIRYSSRKPRRAIQDEVDIRGKLLDLLELTPAERDDLDFVVAHVGDAYAPAALFLSPRNFALGVQQASLDAADDARHSRLDELCRKLFDEAMPDCSAEPGATDV